MWLLFFFFFFLLLLCFYSQKINLSGTVFKFLFCPSLKSVTSKTERIFHYTPEPDRIYSLVFLRVWGPEVSKCTTTQGTNHLLKLNFTLESVGKRCKEDMCVSGVNTKFFIFLICFYLGPRIGPLFQVWALK